MLGEITLTGLTSQGAPSSQLHNWRVGQLLEAVAVSRPAAERLQLRIGGVELEARTQAPIQAGDRVLLKVLSVGTTPTLQVVPAAVAAGNAADVVNHTLRQLLPRQLPTERVLNNLLDVLKNDRQRSQLPPQTRTLIETLLARIPRAEKLADHTRLRQLVTESGLFRELHQQRGHPGHGVDIKQTLLQLARQLATLQPRQQLPAPTQADHSKPVVGTSAGQPAARNPVPATPASSNAPSVSPTLPSVFRAPSAAGNTGTGAEPGAATTAQTVHKATTQNALTVNRSEAGQAVDSQNLKATQPVVSEKALRPVVVPETVAREEFSVRSAWSQNSLLQDIQRQVEGAIARIVLQQTQSVPQPQQEGARWVFELPFQQGDEYHSMPLVIEREATADEGEKLESGWQVELSLELPELGVIEARILIRGEKVSASIWAELESTARLADAELPVLETALESCGLEVGALVCRQGRQEGHQANRVESSLLDFHV